MCSGLDLIQNVKKNKNYYYFLNSLKKMNKMKSELYSFRLYVGQKYKAELNPVVLVKVIYTKCIISFVFFSKK